MGFKLKLMWTKKKACQSQGMTGFLIPMNGGQCKFRTCDPCSVNAVLYP